MISIPFPQALRIKEGLKKIQGSVIGTILDFLSKELRRLLEERKAHAMCLLHDRERQIREATEAHRRQLELRRRLEHDEIFKQVKDLIHLESFHDFFNIILNIH